ncbi:MAG: D-glycero-beta-D-manno-heptose 1-phosphate adenylyltransferase [Candidatus Omnitrophica bacterium]|nr:D-glycero-beta-D-manno-heptose 1-phosphate adenylyltransferase [Candidatus Omnitrophota bacterium]
MRSKLYSRRALARWAQRVRRRGKRIVFTNGCFDIVHAGHVAYLEWANRLGDFLVVGLNSDRSTRKLKGRGRPIQSEEDRARVLCALSCVDCVTIFNAETPLALIRAVRPHVLVKGADWPLSSIAGHREVLSWGGKVKRIRLLKGRSTSKILKKLAPHPKPLPIRRRTDSSVFWRKGERGG